MKEQVYFKSFYELLRMFWRAACLEEENTCQLFDNMAEKYQGVRNIK